MKNMENNRNLLGLFSNSTTLRVEPRGSTVVSYSYGYLTKGEDARGFPIGYILCVLHVDHKYYMWDLSSVQGRSVEVMNGTSARPQHT